MGTTRWNWHHDGYMRRSELCERATVNLWRSETGSKAASQWWEWQSAMEETKEDDGSSGLTETLPYFVAFRMMGVWWWHKRKLLPLAPSNTLSNHSRLSSLCQEGSHLDMRRHANSFISDEGCTFGIYVDDWCRLMFPAYLSLTWTLGMEDVVQKKDSLHVPAGMCWHQMAWELTKDAGDLQ